MLIRRITIITVALHAALILLAAIGSGEIWGVEMMPGIGETVAEVNEAAKSITSGPSSAFDAVVGLALAALSLVADLLTLPFALWGLLGNLGVPPEITAFVLGPMYIAVAFDLVAIMRGDSGI